MKWVDAIVEASSEGVTLIQRGPFRYVVSGIVIVLALPMVAFIVTLGLVVWAVRWLRRKL